MTTDLSLILMIAVSTALSLVFCLLWLIARSGLKAARADLADFARTREMLAGASKDVERLQKVEVLLEDARRQTSELRGELEAKKAEITTITKSHEARLEELRGLKHELEIKFKSLASGILESNSKAFLDRVSERFKTHSQGAQDDLAKRQQAIDSIVKPLNERLTSFETHVKEIEKARNDAYGAIRTQVDQLTKGQADLGTETRKLVQALRAPKTRGRWGEMQLRQVFDMCGMTEHVDYVTEHSIATDEGIRRPDAVVSIPGGKSIVIDAKTPLEAYLDSLESETPEQQGMQLKRHASQVRAHVKLLSSKSYQDTIDATPDFIVMFIPGETFVSAAAEVDPGLIEYAFENRVLIATPTTLMALIKAIAYGWQQEKMAENAVEVQREARELYTRLGKFGEHLSRLGRSLGSTVDSYNKAVGSLEGRVLPTARRFEAMGVVTPPNPISAPDGVEHEPRALSAAEFATTEEVSRGKDG